VEYRYNFKVPQSRRPCLKSIAYKRHFPHTLPYASPPPPLSLSLSLSLYIYIYIYIYLSICLSVCLSIYLSVYLSIYLSIIYQHVFSYGGVLFKKLFVIQLGRKLPTLEVNQSEDRAEPSPPCSADVRNEWSYTYIYTYAFIACTGLVVLCLAYG
jgi:hypothetical protein